MLGAVQCYQRSWRRTDDIRLSDIEPNFVCPQSIGKTLTMHHVFLAITFIGVATLVFVFLVALETVIG